MRKYRVISFATQEFCASATPKTLLPGLGIALKCPQRHLALAVL